MFESLEMSIIDKVGEQKKEKYHLYSAADPFVYLAVPKLCKCILDLLLSERLK